MKAKMSSALKRAIFASIVLLIAAIFAKFKMWPEFLVSLVFALYLANSVLYIKIMEKMCSLEELLKENKKVENE